MSLANHTSTKARARPLGRLAAVLFLVGAALSADGSTEPAADGGAAPGLPFVQGTAAALVGAAGGPENPARRTDTGAVGDCPFTAPPATAVAVRPATAMPALRLGNAAMPPPDASIEPPATHGTPLGSRAPPRHAG